MTEEEFKFLQCNTIVDESFLKDVIKGVLLSKIYVLYEKGDKLIVELPYDKIFQIEISVKRLKRINTKKTSNQIK